ncbi:MAG: hypothetical protein JSS57_14940 [Proteobacteria bacterium]|nr:hypothetical protein [Pseudomonadota bacterium]
MISEKLIRRSLLLSLVFNLVAACLLIFPGNALAQLAGFTASTSPLHTALAAQMVVALGLAYGWLARRPAIDRPLLGFGALVKGTAFLMFAGQWLFGALSGRFVLFASVDIVLALVWLSWLWRREV